MPEMTTIKSFSWILHVSLEQIPFLDFFFPDLFSAAHDFRLGDEMQWIAA